MNKLDIRNLCLADFGHNLNKTCQMLSDVILQRDGPTIIPTLAKKITSELAEVIFNPFFLILPNLFNSSTLILFPYISKLLGCQDPKGLLKSS